jgi:uncharacterized protein (TIGR03000 family)
VAVNKSPDSRLDSHSPAPSRGSEDNSTTPVSKEGPADRLVSREDRPTAFIDLAVPAEADVWFQGAKTRQKGGVRRFVTPPLAEGRTFVYDIRVRWTSDGRRVTRTRRLAVRRGEWWQVNMEAAAISSVSLPLQSAAR